MEYLQEFLNWHFGQQFALVWAVLLALLVLLQWGYQILEASKRLAVLAAVVAVIAGLISIGPVGWAILFLMLTTKVGAAL